MAIQTYVGEGYANNVASQAPTALMAEAQDKNIYSHAAIANGDSIGSLWYIGRVPSNARILFHNSIISAQAIAGLTSFEVGLALTADPASSSILTPPNPLPAALSYNANCLLAATDIHAGGQFNLGPGVGSYNKQFWQIMGLASDPGGYLDVISQLLAAAGAAGTLEAFVQYVRGGP